MAESQAQQTVYVAPPFSEFSNLNDPLTKLLDSIKSAAPSGTPTPASAGAAPGTTDTGAKAYGDAHGKASDAIKAVVTALDDTSIGYFKGMGFTDPNDVSKQRTDVLNSVLNSWDQPASKYMKNAISDGDGLRPAMLSRLQEFDTAVQTAGATPVKPDQ
jgi:hypothetical protein